MIRISFTNEDIELLNHERRYHEHPRVRQKMEALYFKAIGVSHKEICRLADITKATLVSYLREYVEGGISRLRQTRFRKPESELMNHRDALEESLSEKPAATIKEVARRIEQETGLKRSRTAVRRFVKNIGMARYKTGSIPAKADPEKQELFLKQQLEPKIEDMQSGKREIFLSTHRTSSGHPS